MPVYLPVLSLSLPYLYIPNLSLYHLFILTSQAGIDDGHAEVIVTRRNGTDGRVEIDFASKDGTAIAGGP